MKKSNNMLQACKTIECVIDGKAEPNSLVKFFPSLEGINIENCVKEAVKGIRLEKKKLAIYVYKVLQEMSFCVKNYCNQ